MAIKFKKVTVFLTLLIVASSATYLMISFILQKPKDQSKAAPGVPTLSYRLEPQSISPGSNFSLIISVNPNGASFNAFELYSGYDPNTVSFQNSADPAQNITSQYPLISASVDTYNNLMTIIGTKLGSPLSGTANIEIARVAMRVLDQAQGNMIFTWDQNTKLGNKIPIETLDGVFNLAVINSPAPTTVQTSGAGINFKIKVPDVTAPIISLADVQVTLRLAGNAVETANIALVKEGDYYRTANPVNFTNVQNQTYEVFIKTRISIGRLFFNVNLAPGRSLDCISALDPDCGDLVLERDNKLLLSGDSDGFDLSSGSYNKVDSADLQVLSQAFNLPSIGNSPSADFDLDGQIGIADLEILGKNYFVTGD